MRVLNDNVLISAANDTQRTTAAGLYIPETTQDGQVIKGTVVSVGEGRILQDGTRIPPLVQIGNQVWFPKFNASKIEISGVVQYVISEQYILAAE